MKHHYDTTLRNSVAKLRARAERTVSAVPAQQSTDVVGREHKDAAYDVAIVGGSIAGCTAAMLYGRAGLRVAVLERNRRLEAYKTLCGHYILGGTLPTLTRTGLLDPLLAAGAAVSTLRVWNGRAWLHPVDEPAGISLRRERLDPLLRRLAAETPGVDLLLGHRVTDLREDGPRVAGVTATTPDGRQRHIRANLVVGADGHRSPVATMAGVHCATSLNNRFFFWAYYDGLHRPGTNHASGRVWNIEPDVAVSVPTDSGLTLLGLFALKDKLGAFAGDRQERLDEYFSSLPDAPDMARARRASKVVGTTDYPFIRRHPTPRPGLALIGDAACASDPTPAVGCGWAFRSAEWLVTATASALRSGDDREVARGLRDYRRQRAVLERYDRMARSEARTGRLNSVQRALFAAAEHDPDTARRLARFAARSVAPSHVLNPPTVTRALWLSHWQSRRTAQEWTGQMVAPHKKGSAQ
jgi:menaquinone-9 beta-reductase